MSMVYRIDCDTDSRHREAELLPAASGWLSETQVDRHQIADRICSAVRVVFSILHRPLLDRKHRHLGGQNKEHEGQCLHPVEPLAEEAKASCVGGQWRH